MNAVKGEGIHGLNPIETVEAYLAAFSEGRVKDIISLLDENVVWHIDGDPRVSTVGLLKGPERVRRWLQDFPRHFRPLDFSISEMISHNDSILVLGRFRHIILSTNNAVGSDMIIHFKVSAGKIIRYQMFEDSALLSRAFDSGDKWQVQQIRLNGTLYRYRDVGNGPTLIFAHGTFARGETFPAQLQTLSQAYRCITLDMPECDGGDNGSSGMSVDDISRDIALMIEELSLGDIVFIGRGQGGTVGIRLAACLPQRVSGLILIGNSVLADCPEPVENGRLQREPLDSGAEATCAACLNHMQSDIQLATSITATRLRLLAGADHRHSADAEDGVTAAIVTFLQEREG